MRCERARFHNCPRLVARPPNRYSSSSFCSCCMQSVQIQQNKYSMRWLCGAVVLLHVTWIRSTPIKAINQQNISLKLFVNGIWVWACLCSLGILWISVGVYASAHTHTFVRSFVCSSETREWIFSIPLLDLHTCSAYRMCAVRIKIGFADTLIPYRYNWRWKRSNTTVGIVPYLRHNT